MKLVHSDNFDNGPIRPTVAVPVGRHASFAESVKIARIAVKPG